MPRRTAYLPTTHTVALWKPYTGVICGSALVVISASC
jgi:hypothetical protein